MTGHVADLFAHPPKAVAPTSAKRFAREALDFLGSHAQMLAGSQWSDNIGLLGLETAPRDLGVAFRAETVINVQPVDSAVLHTIRVKVIKAWLARTAGAPNEIVQLRALRERLTARGLVL